jgi:DNA-directed RNA polymerase subunit RPC12/RpoP
MKKEKIRLFFIYGKSKMIYKCEYCGKHYNIDTLDRCPDCNNKKFKRRKQLKSNQMFYCG